MNCSKCEFVNCYKIQMGDVYVIAKGYVDCIPRIGTYLTYYPSDSKFRPLLDTSYCNVFGKFLVKEIKKSTKKWWQFWKRCKIRRYVIECVED